MSLEETAAPEAAAVEEAVEAPAESVAAEEAAAPIEAEETAVAEAEGHSDYRLVFNTGPGSGQTVFHTHLHLLAGRPFTWPPG